MTNASAPLMTPCDEHSTAEEVLADVDLSGRRAIVTGASSGIGTETARVLASRGAAVILTARDVTAGEAAAAQIRHGTGNAAVDVRPLELADPASVAAFVHGWDGPLDILVNNAGSCGRGHRPLGRWRAGRLPEQRLHPHPACLRSEIDEFPVRAKSTPP